MVNGKTRETDLVDPALALIHKYGDQEHGLEISVLRKKLREVIQPMPDDLLPLKGRNDDRLSQVIRNLVSHRTLEKLGLAVYRKGTAVTKGSYVLTDEGRRSVKQSWAKRLR